MTTTNLGKVSVTPKGEYDPLVVYERLDIISHNGSSYIVKQTSTGVTPIEGEFYALIAEKGDGGSFVKKAYKTYAAMDADKANIPANSSVDVTNDPDESKNGAYIYDGVAFTRSQYDSKVVTDKIIADTAIAVNDAINNTVLSSGFVIIDSFELGATLTQRNQALRHAVDGKLYRWAGDLPKVVPASSTPTSSGGIAANAWLEVSDSTYSQKLAQVEINKVNTLSTTKTVTVGANGADFTTINAALSELSKFKKSYIKDNAEGNTSAKILLKSGFFAAEQININGVDFGWVDIVSEDAEVVISRAALTTKIGRWYPFIRCKSGVIPSIKCLFSMDSTGDATLRTALYMINSQGFIEQLAGFKNSGDRNVDLTQGSTLNCGRAILTGAGGVSVRPATSSRIFMQYADVSNSATGISCGTGASVAAEEITAQNCGTAVLIQGGCSVDLTSADLRNATGNAIHAEVACTVNARGADVSGAGSYGVYAVNGATIGVENITANNCGGQSAIRSLFGAQVIGSAIKASGNKIALYASRGGNIVTDSAILTGNTTSGTTASEGGTVTATYSNVRNDVAGLVDSANDVRVLSGSTVYMQGSTGGTNQKSDRQTASGIIYKGAKNQASGAVAIAAGATYIDVTHTLDTLPFVQVTAASAMGAATKYWVSNLSATTFRINIDIATTAVSFNWLAEAR